MTLKLSNRTISENGTVICNEDALVEVLFSDKSISNLFCDQDILEKEWNRAIKLCDSNELGPIHVTTDVYENVDWYQQWNTPEPYKNIDVKEYCLNKCTSLLEKERVIQEFTEFEKRDMIPVLRHLMFLVEHWKSKNVVWGVGRGSSVCSFVLYLLEVTLINPLEYNLDLKEWLKE